MMSCLKGLASFFKPSPLKILLFLCFAFLWVAGVTQTYAFLDDVSGIEKPPLYDLLKPFGFWFPWVLFSAPLYAASALICLPYDICSIIISVFPGMGGLKFPVAGMGYSYLASSWMVYSWRKWFTTPLSRRLALLIPIAPTLLLASPMSALMLMRSSEAIFALSSLLLIYFVATFYSISIYGVYRAAGSTFKLIWSMVAGRERHAESGRGELGRSD